jgi:pimeloyl-ACP methyl ester carboxylesterase
MWKPVMRRRVLGSSVLTTLLLAGCSSEKAQRHDDVSVDGGSDATSPDAADAAGSAPSGEVSTTEITVTSSAALTPPFVFDARVAGPEDGEVVFLLHGFPETSYEWMRQLEALAAAGYRAVAPDQRGYSPRARPANVEDYNVILLAQDIVGMADAIGADRFHVVGHDWGAAVAWVVGRISADRVVSLTALSVPHPDAFATVLADMNSCQYGASSYFDLFVMPGYEQTMLQDDATLYRAIMTGVPEDAIEEYLRVLGTEEALGAALNWYRANVGARMLNAPMLGAVTVPTMFVWSDADVALCRDGADLTEQYVDAPYRFEVLEGVNHWIADTAPDELNTLLLDHIPRYAE